MDDDDRARITQRSYELLSREIEPYVPPDGARWHPSAARTAGSPVRSGAAQGAGGPSTPPRALEAPTGPPSALASAPTMSAEASAAWNEWLTTAIEAERSVLLEAVGQALGETKRQPARRDRGRAQDCKERADPKGR